MAESQYEKWNQWAVFLAFVFAALWAGPLTAAQYDVTCNGSDDASAIVSAIAAARTVPGTIQLHGACSVPAGLMVLNRPGITIRGDGPGATILHLSSNGTGIHLGNPAAPFEPCGGIEDLTIEYGPGRSGGFAVLVDGCAKGYIDNVHFGTSPLPPNGQSLGHGIGFCITSPICNRFNISRVTMEIHGAFAGIFFNGGNDQSLSDVDLRCTERQAGSRGILIKSNHGAWMRSVDIVFCEIGVSFEPDSGQVAEFVSFDTVHADSGTSYGWYFGGSGSIRGIHCEACWAGGNGRPVLVRPDLPPGIGTASRGFLIANGDGLVFLGPRIWATGGIGMLVSGAAKNVELVGGWAAASSESAPGTLPGVSILNTGGISITGGFRSGDPLGAPQYQSCGIEIRAGADNFTVADVDLRGNLVGGLCNATGIGPTRLIDGVRQ